MKWNLISKHEIFLVRTLHISSCSRFAARNLREKPNMTLANQNRRWKQLKRRLKRNPCVPSLSDPGWQMGWMEVFFGEDHWEHWEKRGGRAVTFPPPQTCFAFFKWPPRTVGDLVGCCRWFFLQLPTDKKSTLQPFPQKKSSAFFAVSYRENK